MKTPKSLRSGKRGRVIASHNHFGSYESEYSAPKKARTAAQRRSSASFGTLAKLWRKLTEAQRLAWIARAAESKSRSRFGESYPLTGQTYFMRINRLRASFGYPPLTDPPPRRDHIPNPVKALVITNYGERIDLNLVLAEPPAGDIMVFGAAPASPGSYKCFKCPCLGPLPPPVGGLIKITSLYVKRYGVPPVGKRVFIRIRPANDGPRDRYVQFHAIVPTRQARTSQSAMV